MQSIDPFAVPAGLNSSFYPMAGYDNSRELDYDVSMMKEMYPLLVRQILLEIENECDKLEYAGSFMFDEIPDKTLILMLTDKIYRKVAPAFSDDASLVSAEFHDRGTVLQGMACRPALTETRTAIQTENLTGSPV